MYNTTLITPKRLVFCVNEDAEINDIFYEKVDKHQFTRIPVYRDRKDRVVGILYLKDLLTIEDQEVLKVSDITRTNSHIRVDDDETLDDILSLFLSKKVKIAMVYSGKEFLGVITLEDLLEEILQEELYDEMDQTSKARKSNYRKMERE